MAEDEAYKFNFPFAVIWHAELAVISSASEDSGFALRFHFGLLPLELALFTFLTSGETFFYFYVYRYFLL